MRLILTYSLLISLLSTLATTIPQLTFGGPDHPDDSQLSKSILSPKLKIRIEYLRKKWGVPGLAIGLVASPEFASRVHGTEVEEWKMETAGFGIANRFGEPVTSDTLFGIASNSKLFTALCVSLLVHNGTILKDGKTTLEWNTKIKDIVPEWKLMDEYASDHANLLDLLSMRSGLPRHDYISLGRPPAEVVASLRYLKPSAELRENWQYNNHHYVVMDHIIHTLTNLSLPEYAQIHLFDPLKMDSTTYNATKAAEHHRSDGKQSLKDCVGQAGSLGWWVDGDALFDAGPGGVILSATDMTKWVQELLSPSVLPPDLIKKATTGFSIPSGVPDFPEYGVGTYGLGQRMYTYRGFAVHGHTGDVPGQVSVMARLPELGIGLMIAANDQDFGATLYETVQNEIFDELLGLAPIDWEGRFFAGQFVKPTYPEVPTNPRPPPSFEVAGVYRAPAVGDLDLIKVSLPKLSETVSASVSPSSGKPLSASSILSITRAPLNVTGPVYMAWMGKHFLSAIYVTHFDGPLFNWTAIYATDRLNTTGTDGILYTAAGTGTVVVSESEGGIGLFGNMWGKGETAQASVVTEIGVKEASEAWFEKL
ncbi:hypothetical protein IAR55_006878 [Kwoniella newhampshirensis]|uniref:Beta-lactamase-related domain-containing protein n=1 Tax=Kwoniella newhampshirensis TaxID=1651941 RepID=A0AAW0YTP6_9TREE